MVGIRSPPITIKTMRIRNKKTGAIFESNNLHYDSRYNDFVDLKNIMNRRRNGFSIPFSGTLDDWEEVEPSATIEQSVLDEHNNTVDWEQRRYEIAKDVLSNNNESIGVSEAVNWADELIIVLRNNPVEFENN